MRHSYLLLALAAVFAATTAGCGLTCKDVQAKLEEAKTAELAEARTDEGADEPTPQLAIGLRTDTLETVAADVAASAIETLVSASKSLDVAGDKPVTVDATPDLESFDLDRREEACPHCFRISADLSGNLAVDIPVLGKRTVPMTGEIQFVAPMTLGPGDEEGTTVIQLDLAEAARENAPIVVLELTDLRKSWKHTLEELLASKLADSLVEQLEPVTLASFQTPDFGLPNLDVQPIGLRISSDGDVVHGLFSSDIPIPDPPEADDLAEAASPADDHNLAIAIPTRLVPAGVAYGFRTGDISRTYSDDGEATDEGPFHVTVRNFAMSPRQNGDDDGADGYNFDFRAWRLEEGGPCYWLDGTATGDLKVAGTDLAVTIDDVDFTASSGTDFTVAVANWVSAEFLKSGAQIVGASLDGENVSFPGAVYGVTDLSLQVADDFLTLSAVAKEQQDADD